MSVNNFQKRNKPSLPNPVTKESVATGIALLALMLTAMLDGVLILAFVAVAIVIYAALFWRQMSTRDLLVAGLAFLVAFVVAAAIGFSRL